jgi:hypothetical protein
MQVWGILASVLHIASLQFTTEDTAEGEIVHLDPDVQQVCRHCMCIYIIHIHITVIYNTHEYICVCVCICEYMRNLRA